MSKDNLNSFLLELKEISLSEFNAFINIIDFAIIVQTLKTSSVPIVCYHFQALRTIGYPYCCTTDSCKSINYQLSLSTLAANPFADRTRRSSRPRRFIEFYSFVKPFEECISLNPETVNITGGFSLFNSCKSCGLPMSKLFFESSWIWREVNIGYLDKKMPIVDSNRDELFVR